MKSVETLPPEQMIVQIVLGSEVSRILGVIERLNIANHLLDGPKDVASLASLTGTHEDALYRVLRMIATLGVFAETAPRTFANTEGSLLLSGAADGWPRSLVRLVNSNTSASSWLRLDHSVRTGQPAFDEVFGEDCFAYMASHPENAEMFHAAMSSSTFPVGKALLASYDFSTAASIADLGGGHGGLLTAIVTANPHLRGTVLDLPQALPPNPQSPVVFEAGDFFARVPAADLYILKHVLHDWDDEHCVRILSNCRAAMPANGRVLVIEHLLDTISPEYVRLLDIEMLVMTPRGRERSVAEFQALFEKAGLTHSRVIPLLSSLSLVEATSGPAAR